MIINRNYNTMMMATTTTTTMMDGNNQQTADNIGNNVVGSTTTTTATTSSSSSSIIMDAATLMDNFLKYYEERMVSYIYQQPHLPPTSFELKLKHKQTKQDLLNMFEKHLRTESNQMDPIVMMNDCNFLCKHLDNSMEQSFNSIMELSLKEYRLCQTGFIIGWKDNKQRQQPQQSQQQQQNASNSNNNNNHHQLINAKLADYYIVNDRF
ncbi:uncharacterized protein LOC124496877 [Dermatophagoides farinae]|uniref:Uncharacterized protein n=2 Tax=Dermatophagoides farinae TaxID=6954 RepID=A0A922HRU2_DERFA|nr:hypothetical protein DERF_012359 [Dermatophagoides farinae]